MQGSRTRGAYGWFIRGVGDKAVWGDFLGPADPPLGLALID